MKNYSQNNEQEVILEFFSGTVGRFLDIGAFDGVTLSNTRAMAELGWSGIMVEPSPFCAVDLIRSVEEFDRRVDVVLCAVSDTTGLAVLKMSGDYQRVWANSIEPRFPENYIPSSRNVTVQVPTVRIGDLLERGPFDFISIDAEWKDFDILRDAPKGLPGCSLLCIEPDGTESRKEMIRYLRDHHDFVVHYETNENILAKRVS